MHNHQLDNDTLSCTAIGTLLVILNSINPVELLNSVVIAATGTLVSFIVSLACKFIWRKMREKI